MRQENAIEVNHVSKSFKLFSDKGHELKDHVVSSKRRKYTRREVLKDVSFSVKKGEAVGLIGHNGCGKSTTLKLLTKIMYPDSGSLDMRGRVSSLIELGAGFHPDMSGRENIYINASIFGLTRKEIDRRLDDIIAFSELEGYIDNPVRTYSSGMYMRLAFSVAINVDADILLVDEILAVGDLNFQAKCFNRMREIKAEGTTIVIVSHALNQIEQICDRTLWIHDGRIKADGKPRDIHPEYMDYMGGMRQGHTRQEKGREASESDAGEDKRWGNGDARIREVHMLNAEGEDQTSFRTGERVEIKFPYEVKNKVRDAVFGIGIFRVDGLQCYGTNTRIDKVHEFELTKDGETTIVLDSMNLIPGEYLLDVAIESEMGIPVDYYREARRFEVYSEYADVGIARLDHKWRFSTDKEL